MAWIASVHENRYSGVSNQINTSYMFMPVYFCSWGILLADFSLTHSL